MKYMMLAILGSLIASNAIAIETTNKNSDLYEHQKNLEEAAQIGKIRSLRYRYTITQPLPVEPGTPNYTLVAGSNDKFELVFWRQLQSDGTYIPLIRVTPLTTNPTFICGPSFKVIVRMNLGKYGINSSELTLSDNVSILAENDTSFCDDINAPTTFVWDQWTHKPQYDDKQAFVMIHDWNDDFIKIPALDGTTVLNNGNSCTINATSTSDVKPNLDIHIPNANYPSSQGTLNLWVDLKVFKENNRYLWELKDYGINK